MHWLALAAVLAVTLGPLLLPSYRRSTFGGWCPTTPAKTRTPCTFYSDGIHACRYPAHPLTAGFDIHQCVCGAAFTPRADISRPTLQP